jgi:hypothetical protein
MQKALSLDEKPKLFEIIENYLTAFKEIKHRTEKNL